MISISVCMIVKNEEDVLGRCLSCAEQFADEIIVVDTGSTDSTWQIAENFTDKIYDFQWVENFSMARNFSFSKAVMDYCMWLDADDVIDEKNIQALLQLKETLSPNTDMVKMKYNTGFDSQGNVTFSYYRERLMKRTSSFSWKGAVHEAIEAHGTVIYSDIAICHKKIHPSDGDRNLRIYEHQLSLGETLSPRDQFYYARELYYHQRFDDAIDILKVFIDSRQGWVENNIEACKLLSKCYLAKNNNQMAFRALFLSFEFDVPRAEICCDAGDLFLASRNFKTAVFWYETAAKCLRNDTSGGFVQPDCYDYYPFIQLCVCYDKLGNRELAVKYNDKAGEIKPLSKAYLYNKEYFSTH